MTNVTPSSSAIDLTAAVVVKPNTTTSTGFLSSPSTASTMSGTTTNTNSNNNNTNEYLPTNVCTMEQLNELPIECLSYSNPYRPIQHVNEDGYTITTYSLTPMSYSVFYILIVEILERFSFYSINYTLTSYLTGQYNPTWNANMDSITASTYVSISIALAYTTPFLGAILGDRILGEYYSIIVGAICFYWPGLVLILLTSIPYVFHTTTFNHTALRIGLLLLFPIGSGIVKSMVNVFGAKQFHPLLQSSLIETYYVNFYMCINIGALMGGLIVPMIASQYSVSVAYMLPVCMMFIGISIFVSGTKRYVTIQPKIKIKTILTNVLCCSKSKNKKKKKKNKKRNIPTTTTPSSSGNEKSISIQQLFRVFLLIIPFCIVYNQMPTTFILQGTVMRKALYGYIDSAIMYNNDTISVLLFGYLIGSHLYPYLLTKYNIKIPTTYKFAIGSSFGSLAILCAYCIDQMIRYEYLYNNQKHTVLIVWQAIPYILLGIGEIFTISSAYEVAFTSSSTNNKILSSALNIFCIGGLPNLFNIGLYHVCSPWFINTNTNTTNISNIEDYVTAHIDYYFLVLFSISLIGVIVNVLPWVRQYVESIESTSIDMIKTPKTPKIGPPIRRHHNHDDDDATDNDDDNDNDDDDLIDEQRTLLEQQRHEYYVKYGSDRTLYHANSMRAGPSITLQKKLQQQEQQQQQQSKQQHQHGIKKTTITTLYHVNDDDNHNNNKTNVHNNKSNATTTASTIVSVNGKPVSEWKPTKRLESA